MKRYFAVLFVIMTIGCASKIEVARDVTTMVRRMPQMNRIETGRASNKGEFSASLTGLISVQKPDYLLTTDQTFETRSDLVGNEISIVNTSNTFCYETRYMLSGEGMFTFSDYLSSGLSLDASLGKVEQNLPTKSTMINNLNLEGSLFLRFSKKFDRTHIAIKPEIVFSNLFGNQVVVEIVGTNNDTTVVANDKINRYLFAIRCSSALRFDIIEKLALFSGIQIKSQPFYSKPDRTETDIAYGLFAGVSTSFNRFHVSPFVAIPLRSTMGRFRSPVAIGIETDVIFSNE